MPLTAFDRYYELDYERENFALIRTRPLKIISGARGRLTYLEREKLFSLRKGAFIREAP